MTSSRRPPYKQPRNSRPASAASSNGETAGLKARQFATQLLKAVFVNKQPFDDTFAVMSAAAPYGDLAVRDRAFARAIGLECLRRFGQIEALLHRFLEKPLPQDALEARLILAVAATQLLFMDVAAHAAIDLAVEQAKQSRQAARFSGLMNAVLRRVAREGAELIAQQDVGPLNTAGWLYKRWLKQYGAQTTQRIVEAHRHEPALDLSVKSAPETWAARLGGHVTRFGGVRLAHKGRIEDIEGYDEGAWWVQDAAASLPVRLLGDVDGKSVADLCAAPGGKTAQLAARGARVTAVDVSASRIRRLSENMQRLDLDIAVVQANAAEWQPEAAFDAVLLDAPCSATGTLRRNPDISYLKSEADIASLAALQQRLLLHAASLVKPGGTLMYCTCSLEAEEGEAQAERFLQTQTAFKILPIRQDEIALPPEALTPDGLLRTLPFFDPMDRQEDMGEALLGMDGFFIARFIGDYE